MYQIELLAKYLTICCHIQQVYCTVSLTDEEMFMLDETFYPRSTLTASEESTLYISGYVTFKENSATIEPTDATKGFPSSEYICFVYCYYKNGDKSCVNY